MTRLTDTRVFDRPWDEAAGEYVDQRKLLPESAGQADVHLLRTDGAAVADIPQRFVVHSPTGFEWGYGGSGPSDLALNILGLFVAPPEAWRLHQHYKREVIAAIDQGAPGFRHTITAASVRDWLTRRWAVEDVIRANIRANVRPL